MAVEGWGRGGAGVERSDGLTASIYIYIYIYIYILSTRPCTAVRSGIRTR